MQWPAWRNKTSAQASSSSPSQPDSNSVTPESPIDPSRNPTILKPSTWVSSLLPTALLTLTTLATYTFYRTHLRRIPGAAYVSPRLFRKKTLFGTVTRVGDGDNFHLFHTPGGRLAGWGWIRKVPVWEKGSRATISVRIAGVDAPELAHFGKPSQPHAKESLAWLQSYILHRRVRVAIHSRDQHNRIVGTVWLRRYLFWRRDVGLEMLRRGWATVYETKGSEAEFGGMEGVYREMESGARERGVGIWGEREKVGWESPREFKSRMREEDGKAREKEKGQAAAATGGDGQGSRSWFKWMIPRAFRK